MDDLATRISHSPLLKAQGALLLMMAAVYGSGEQSEPRDFSTQASSPLDIRVNGS